MPEVPENMQQNLAHLEQEAQARSPLSPTGSMNYQQDRQSLQTPAQLRSPTTGSMPESPNFSPLPVLRYHPPNVPPTDEQREATLEAAREQVLASNDPENQLIWAQDALTYVDVSNINEQRVSPRQGVRPHTPTIEKRLKDDALNIVKFLAGQNHPRAQFMMGTWLEFGKYGYRVDKKEAFHCYTRASERGFARAEYRIGMQFENSGDPFKAIKYYQKGADAGDSASHYRLGMLSLLGQHGQPQDFQAGIQHIYTSAQAADENAPQGAYIFGLLQVGQLDQVKVPSQFLQYDLEGARVNIEKAAYLGFSKAQVKMGTAYELCDLGCDFNPALSLHYSALAARQGEPEAEMAISKWFLSGYEGVFRKNEEMAFVYAERAASSGLETAEFALGYFHEVGIYVPVDLKVARQWYEKAARKGNTDAKSRIAALMQSQVLSRADHEQIALSKIRQRYGSQHQGPQEGFPVANGHQPMNMPDPTSMMSPTSTYHSFNPAPGWSSAPPPGPADFRPTSAFGINPNIRPGSAATIASLPSSQPGPPVPPVPAAYQRPHTSTSEVRPGYGRGGPPRPGPPPGQMGYPRPGPGMPPPGMNRPPTNRPLMNQRPPPGGRGMQPPGMNRPPPNQRPPADFGFTAPQDPSGADRPPRYGPNGQNQNDIGRPPRTTSRPADPGYGAAPNRNTASSMPNNQATDQESHRPAAAQPPARPPPRGPKTFEEMGVPAQKNGDCIIM